MTTGASALPTPGEAEALVRERVQPLPVESRPLESLAGAVLAQSVRSERDQPPFNRVTMDGIAFARAVRAGGAWEAMPLIALSSRAEPADVSRGREAGFTDYVAKYDREALLQSLQDCLSTSIAA